MSLQVWLPLTKDLRQQGLSNISVTGSPASWGNGKLGKCATWNGAVANIIYNNTTDFNYTENFSVAMWINPVYTGSTAQYVFTVGRADAGGYGYGLQITSATQATFRFGNRAVSFALASNEWNHVVMTVDTVNVIVYKNGTQVATNTIATKPTYSDGNGMGLGCFHYSGNIYPYYGSLNDFRIYDHCLSQMEVKELAKGLVLHYPLNRQGWGQENLVWNSNWNIHSTTPPESWVNWGSPPTREIVTIDGKNWLHVISNTTQFQGYSQNWTKRNGVGELTANTKMTVSFTAKLAAAASIAPIGIHWCNSSGTIVTQNWTTTALTTSPKRYSFTYTTPADCVAFNIMVGDNTNTAHEVWVTDIKLELGEIATPWCPNSSDALATTMGLNSTTEYDCSGFCNNGDKIGTLTYTSDTPKYQVSTHIGATTSKVHISNFPTSGFGNSYSFVWWGKRSSNGPMFWGFSDGIRLNGMYAGTLWNTGDSSSNPIYVPGTTTTITAPSVNVWHHYVMTGDGTTCKLYVDGVLYGQAKTYKAISGTSIYINGWDSSISYCSDNTNISDFRIYATALSADDVKSLYQNCATIDPDGTIRGQIRS